MALYPLKFSSLLKERIWGGTKLTRLFGKERCDKGIGESWELSGLDHEPSVVSNGFLTGKKLTEVMETYQAELLGEPVIQQFGLAFPLLFKLIDANDNLSIQVHPNDQVARERHQSYGKTEMWYVVDSEPDGKLIIGFNQNCTREKYEQALAKNDIESLLQHVTVTAGDVFFIPAGLIHAIGKGVVIAEIQQSSDITYRIYDYQRVDKNGHQRPLHTQEAMDVICFDAKKVSKVPYSESMNHPVTLVASSYFHTSLLRANQSITRNYASIDSFVVYMCIEGTFTIEHAGEKTVCTAGETILLPACIEQVELQTTGEYKLLEVYVP